MDLIRSPGAPVDYHLISYKRSINSTLSIVFDKCARCIRGEMGPKWLLHAEITSGRVVSPSALTFPALSPALSPAAAAISHISPSLSLSATHRESLRKSAEFVYTSPTRRLCFIAELRHIWSTNVVKATEVVFLVYFIFITGVN